MPVEHLGWLLPPLKEAYAHRKEILSFWQKIEAKLRGQKRTIAFTGLPGVGKTVLFDHLTGRAYAAGYHPPAESQDDEQGEVSFVGKRLRLVVVPGQHSSPRLETIGELFNDKDTVDGVVHVVANGFAETRNDTAREVLVADRKVDTTAKYRALQHEAELRDLEATCELIRRSLQHHRRPKWLLVAVAKVDLYYGELDAARARYSPHSDSPFARRLKELRAQVGSDNFRWDAQPVCAWLEDFHWHGEINPSTIKPSGRDHYVANFARALENLC